MVGEEAPAVGHVLVGKEDAHSVVIAVRGGAVASPYETQKQGAGRGHDGDVGRVPRPRVRGQGIDDAEKEGMRGDGTHYIVGDARGPSGTDPGRV